MSELPISCTIGFPYKRTLGPILGRFFTALRDGRILGIRCGSRILCPPMEFDPDTGATLEPDFVEVGPGPGTTHGPVVAARTAAAERRPWGRSAGQLHGRGGGLRRDTASGPLLTAGRLFLDGGGQLRGDRWYVSEG